MDLLPPTKMESKWFKIIIMQKYVRDYIFAALWNLKDSHNLNFLEKETKCSEMWNKFLEEV
jgi:hypothetical protein